MACAAKQLNGSEVTVLTEKAGKASGRSKPQTDHVNAFAVVLGEEFGTSFLFYNSVTGEAVLDRHPGDSKASGDLLKPDAVLRIVAEDRSGVDMLPNGAYRLAIILYEAGAAAFLAVGILLPMARKASEATQERARLQKWVQSFSDRL